MKTLRRFAPIFLLASALLPLSAQSGDTRPLFHAAELRDAGRFREEVASLLPLVQTGSGQLGESERGVAWNMLGLAYQDLADYDSAGRCYASAIGILNQHPADAVLYAPALDNLGSLKMVTGDFAASTALREQARRIYEQLGDHAGVARSSGNLARVAIEKSDWKAARRDLDTAFREAKLAGKYPDGDMAALLASKASLFSSAHEDEGALASMNEAIALWVRSHGPDSFMLGVGYSLRAQAYDRLGDTRRAALDMQHALTILAKTSGKDTPGYRKTQAVYVDILRHAADLQQASSFERTRQSIASLQQHSCGGCNAGIASTR